ncbi:MULTISPECIES: mycothiol synthase [unclassified Cryobacterium]|uniref:mycothiol synthase n=1 Tax=unclassified Cryobacterium TaxID=2649013 RepID=UPI002AB5DD29|nr:MULTISPECIES: mycothiol synthase [unclassified Cryobacterium]MDY7541391.1 mycothiol synthase [Cryobacterium sp. 5B3]MEB0000502.1 mycothiol synthase [Cryobacterium sp. RTS3]MEB0267534.1 mycothiol synthase [Cryobacterium sp. 10I5]MEB0273310.1 mycothiol synthase [Cryobacterium sp. 5B3]
MISPSHGPDDSAFALQFAAVTDAAARVDGYAPLNEQATLDVAAGRRTPLLLRDGDAIMGPVVGALVLGAGELDLVVHPDFRWHGHATAALTELFGDPAFAADVPDGLTAWAHGDHPAARALAGRFGFDAVRRLLQLQLALDAAAPPAAVPPATTAADDIVITAFDPDTDADAWVALNAGTFAAHPEQGGITAADLADRMNEDWFDAGDFLVARHDTALIGYNWLKLEQGAAEGEIYVVGVSAEWSGRGLGRRLMTAGLERLRQRGVTQATLYVEADNGPAVRLYRSLGFTDRTVDVQYRRRTR